MIGASVALAAHFTFLPPLEQTKLPSPTQFLTAGEVPAATIISEEQMGVTVLQDVVRRVVESSAILGVDVPMATKAGEEATAVREENM